MNNKELLSELSKRLGKSQKEVASILDVTSEAIVSSLREGNTISIQGFGSFETREKQSRDIINPSTKAVISVPAKTSVVFKAGTNLKDKLKNIKRRGK